MTESTAIQVSGVQAVDSLSANEFAVELEGERVAGVFRVSGLISFKLDVRTTTSLKPIKEPVKIAKMVQRDSNAPFNRWLRDTREAKADIVRPTRALAILALDDGIETRRWTLKRAWISEVSYSDFNTGSGELIEETFTIQWDDIDETWPAG